MADWNLAWPITLEHEGGYKLTNRKADSGGQTFAGISRVHNPHWRGWDDIDDGNITEATHAKAEAFFRDEYWDPLSLDDVVSQSVASALFSCAVLSGVRTASRLAQAAVGTTPDGRIGPITMQAINAAGEELFLALFALARITRYDAIVQRRPKDRVNFRGWVRRALRDFSC